MDPRELLAEHTEAVWNRGELDAVDDFVAAEYVEHDPTVAETLRGREAYKANVEQFRTAFPDITVTIEDTLVEGDRIALRQRFTGTHRGPFMGIEPTGETVDVSALLICRIADGKIAETWVQTDTVELLAQLGVELP